MKTRPPEHVDEPAFCVDWDGGLSMEKRPPEHVDEPRPELMPAQDIEDATGEALIRKLLDISLQRLEGARALEQERRIVYPETTSILRDCERLARKLRGLKNDPSVRTVLCAKTMPAGGRLDDDDDDQDGAFDLDQF
ncbi:MAG: hypothetical protein NTV22_04960 [bacterium]|nr:hypothetical protein [bacterium]